MIISNYNFCLRWEGVMALCKLSHNFTINLINITGSLLTHVLFNYCLRVSSDILPGASKMFMLVKTLKH